VIDLSAKLWALQGSWMRFPNLLEFLSCVWKKKNGVGASGFVKEEEDAGAAYWYCMRVLWVERMRGLLF